MFIIDFVSVTTAGESNPIESPQSPVDSTPLDALGKISEDKSTENQQAENPPVEEPVDLGNEVVDF